MSETFSFVTSSEKRKNRIRSSCLKSRRAKLKPSKQNVDVWSMFRLPCCTWISERLQKNFFLAGSNNTLGAVIPLKKKNILKTSDIHLPVSIYMTAVVSCVHSADIVIWENQTSPGSLSSRPYGYEILLCPKDAKRFQKVAVQPSSREV